MIVSCNSLRNNPAKVLDDIGNFLQVSVPSRAKIPREIYVGNYAENGILLKEDAEYLKHVFAQDQAACLEICPQMELA